MSVTLGVKGRFEAEKKALAFRTTANGMKLASQSRQNINHSKHNNNDIMISIKSR